jgi:hypothetical protein
MKPKSQNSGIREGQRRPPVPRQRLSQQVSTATNVTVLCYGLIPFVPSYNNVFNVKKRIRIS